jgi:Zn-dependent protease
MVQLGRLLRWFFGLNAILFAAVSVRYLLAFAPLVTHTWTEAEQAIARVIGYALMAAGYGTAFIKIRKGGRQARLWALAASALNIPFYFFFEQAWLWTAAGILGLFVFWRKETVDAFAVKSVKVPRARGDGTSSSMDHLANILLFIGFLAAGSCWGNWAMRENLPDSNHLFLGLLWIEAAMLLTTVAHESGHALAASLLRMKVRRFVVGPLQGSFRSGKWKMQFRAAGFLGAPGGVGVVPSDLENLRYRHALVAAGGPVASLVTGLVAMGITLTSKGHFWEAGWKLAAYTTTFSMLAFLFNLIPMRPESVYSDGARIYQLLGRSLWSDVHLALSMGSCTLASPMRPRDCDIGVLNRATAFLTKGMEALVLRVQAQAFYHDAGMRAEAIAALEDAERVYAESVPELRADLHKSFVFGNALLKRDAARARQWWTLMEAKGNATRDAEYWFSLSALLCSEGRFPEAETALDQSLALMTGSHEIGAYEYERDCAEQLRSAMESRLVAA